MELLKAIKTRYSARNFKPDQIDNHDLNTILGAASAAPVGMKARETIHLTVVQNNGLLSEITKATAKIAADPTVKPFYGAPTVVIVSAKPSTLAEGIEYANAACIIENMLLTATDLGLGSVYLWGFITAISNNEDIMKKLAIPDGFKIISAAAIGYADGAIPAEKQLRVTIGHNIIK